MLTPDQEKWIEHLSNNPISIHPYNPESKEAFEKLKKELQDILGNIEIVHRGASSLEISGKGELDIYIPVIESQFDHYLKKLMQAYGKPGSLYPLERVRFNRKVDGIEAEIFLINKKAQGWIDGQTFENYVKAHPDVLAEYAKLKESLNGLPTKEYYRKKLEFYNEILEKAK
jgi:GrpB-like predicted nucleotidyltransferase (UPF0157 family)